MARNLKIGDAIFTKEGEQSIVTNIEVVRKLGVYAPLTSSGGFVVNNFIVSCYGNQDHHVAHIVLGKLANFAS